MAYTMDASWVAAYVERAKPLAEKDKNQLLKNIKLARELGAEIITTADENVAEALVRVARQQNVTQVLVGKPQHSISFRKSLLEGVIRKSGDLDIYVVGGEEQAGSGGSFRLPEAQSGITQYISAIASVCTVALFCYPAASFLGYQSVSLILLLTVAILPLKFGAGPVVSAAAVSALVWDFFFIPPQFTLVVARGQDILMLVMYFVIAAVTGTLTARIRAREKSVRQREERAVALYNLTGDLSKTGTQDEVASVAVANIKRVFGGEAAVFLSQPDGDIFTAADPASSYQVDPKEFGVASWVYWNEKTAGRFTDTLPFAQATYYPVTGPRYPLGVVGVKLEKNERLSIEQEALLQNFLRQIAATLEREQLNEIAKKSITFVESERLYKTLFNSLSHELRTPIAAIVSASEGLIDEKTSRNEEVRKNLTGEVHTAAGRLNRLVDNLLDMTRLESGRITPVFDWCDIRDLFNAVMKKLKNELASHVVTIEVAEEMPFVKLDFGLMEQALANLLFNASLYTPQGTMIGLKAYVEGKECIIVVSDSGPGFPRESLGRIFEKFYRVPGTKAGGAGLGLSIAKGFVEAHSGSIAVGNNEPSGARFVLRLPLEEERRIQATPS
jgi:two-component system sensor histidine kinase KdpD